MLIDKNEQELKSILKKYLNQEANAAETEMVDFWYQQLGAGNMDDPFLSGTTGKEEVLNDIQRYLYPYTVQVKKSLINSTYLRIAAILLLCLGVAWFWPQKKLMPQQELLISTIAGTHKEIKLTDGTIVLLNAKSKLRVAKDFGQKDRKVFLEGEAYFKVATNAGKPFLIRSGQLSTRVLGTSFNINAYPEKDRIKVVVSTGKIQVSKTEGGKTEILAAGMTSNQSVSYYKQSGKYELKKEDASLISSWRDNRLYIDNASVTDIGHQLELHYNIKVLCKLRHPSNDKYTIRFNHESIDSVLKILSMLTKNKFTYSNQQILIQ